MKIFDLLSEFINLKRNIYFAKQNFRYLRTLNFESNLVAENNLVNCPTMVGNPYISKSPWNPYIKKWSKNSTQKTSSIILACIIPFEIVVANKNCHIGAYFIGVKNILIYRKYQIYRLQFGRIPNIWLLNEVK